ncbi:TBC1 domain family member 14 [Choanephora cucurbitarum]|uniref:TBC1 domain family member 14 n=1 Tax=Choanephora cucurbitarum TaxID=101091 RepID=A0A1C7NP43_9FUNG|nr:TBC1 domain family member 14 [Choanephora cucurbitarum]
MADIDLSANVSSVGIVDNQGTLTADKLLDELPTPQHQPLYTTEINSSRSTYDQFFEEVSLDLPRDAQADTSYDSPSRLMKFIPRRANSQASTKTNTPSRNSFHADTSMKITTSDISGPFYSISDVLDDASQQDTLSPEANMGGEFHSIDMSPNPRAARRNVNEAEVVVTAGGASLPDSLNPFKRNKVIHQKPSPLESVISKTRPRMLPPKDPQEEKKHLQEYEAMMKKARKLEAKKQKENHKKKEEKDKKINQAQQVWENDIIPHWKTRARDRRTLILWTQGIPPRCRKKVWKLRIGNALDINKSTFTECTRRVPQAIRTSKTTNNGLTSPTSHGSPMPIEAASHPTTYDAYAEQSVYPRRRQRRTSSLDVLREELREEKLNYREDNASTTTTTTTEDGDEIDLEGMAQIDFNTNIEHSSSSTSSFPNSLGEHHHGFGGTLDTKNDTIELDTTQRLDDIHLSEENPSDDGDEDASSHDEDSEEEMIGDSKVIQDPAIVNFLNKAIDEDIVRTLPSLCVFQPDGPLFMSLRKVLYAYVGYRHDLTYPRGTSFLAGVLLLNMNAQDTFTSLVNLINSSQVLSALYSSDEKKIQGFFKVFNVIFAENLPKLYLHFKNLTLTPENYLPDWFMTIFSSIIPLELSSRLWDIYLLYGDIILFRTGLVVLKHLEPLLWGGGFGETVRILNMGFIGESRGEEVKAALAVSGHIIEHGGEDPFFDEILGRKGVHLDEARFKELLNTHMPYRL